MKQYTDKWITIDGHKIRYFEDGEDGQSLLLIHGLGCSALEWSENIDELAKYYRVTAVDLIGFGKSDRPKNFSYSPSNQASVLKKISSALNLGKVNVVGNSYGGLVAIEFARLYPEMTSSLTLVNSAGGGLTAPFGMRLLSLPLVGEYMTKPTRQSCKQGFEFVMYDPALLEDERVDANYAYSIVQGSKYSTLSTLRGIINITGFIKSYVASLHAFLKQSSVRTLIIWGKHDPLLPIDHALKFQSLINNSVLNIFENAGHAPMFECPQLFNKTLISFFEQSENTPPVSIVD